MSDEVKEIVSASKELITNITNSKIEVKSELQQPSPGSTKGSESSGGSGVPEEPQPTSQKNRDIIERQRSSSVSNVLAQLRQLIVSDEWTRKEHEDGVVIPHVNDRKKAVYNMYNKKSNGPILTELGRSLVTSYSLKAYIDLLGTNHRQNIASWLYGNTSSALSSLFRFPNSVVYCEDSDSAAVHSVRNGIGHAVRLALRHVYGSEYGEFGWRCFANKGAPVIYLSPSLHMDLHSYMINQFAIDDCISVGKLDSPLSDVEARMSHIDLEKQLIEDKNGGKKPLLVVAVVGSAIFGQNDMVSRLLELRNEYHFWLHLVGQGLTVLTLKEPPETMVQILNQADSLTLPLSQWIGIPAAPVVTLHRQVDNLKPTYREKLDTLPWWVAIQHLTQKRIIDTFETAYYLSKLMLKGLSQFPLMEILHIPKVQDYVSKVYRNQAFPLTVLIFKYNYYNCDNSTPITENTDEKYMRPTDEDVEYADSLNSWLGQGLISECRSLGLHLIELGGIHGTAFRFCPLESAASCGTRPEDVQLFVKQLADTLVVVNATVKARRRLGEILTRPENASLRRSPLQKWAGAGAVCYTPSIVKDTLLENWNDKQKQQVSHLNLELVHSLRVGDTAFSSGENSLGISCVKFGMLANDKDLDDLIAIVVERGRQIEGSAQYMESLAEMIKEGIDAANEDLRRENDQRLMQEGLIRQLPIMGSFVNWLSPMDKENGNIKGRSFDLKTGRIMSTLILHKHRLQIGNEGTAEPASPMAQIETSQFPHISSNSTTNTTTTVDNEAIKYDPDTNTEEGQ